MAGTGRVLTAVGKGQNFEQARNMAYRKVSQTSEMWPTCRWRKDIAERVSNEEKS